MSSMATWKILEDMTLKLRRKGVEIPANIINDLRSAKSMLEISTAEKGSGDFLAKIQECTDNVEAFLTAQVEKTFGVKAADDFLKQLEDSSCPTCQTGQPTRKTENKFVSGVPRDQKWIRVEPIDGLSDEKLRQMAQEQNLSVSPQEDGKLVVYGKPEDIKAFVKKMIIQTKVEL
jgi:hypothetical protein